MSYTHFAIGYSKEDDNSKVSITHHSSLITHNSKNLFFLKLVPHAPVLHLIALAFGDNITYRQRGAGPVERFYFVAGEVEFGFPVDSEIDTANGEFGAADAGEAPHVVFSEGIRAAGTIGAVVVHTATSVKIESPEQNFMVFFGQKGDAEIIGSNGCVQNAFRGPAIGDVLLNSEVDAVVDADTGSGFIALSRNGMVEQEKCKSECGKQANVFHIAVWHSVLCAGMIRKRGCPDRYFGRKVALNVF